MPNDETFRTAWNSPGFYCSGFKVVCHPFQQKQSSAGHMKSLHIVYVFVMEKIYSLFPIACRDEQLQQAEPRSVFNVSKEDIKDQLALKRSVQKSACGTPDSCWFNGKASPLVVLHFACYS